jgi:hypothetical protein
VKTSELKGGQLDYAVALALGCTFRDNSIGGIHAFQDGKYIGGFAATNGNAICMPHDTFAPSRYWSIGGPIIEREQIALLPLANDAPHRWASCAYPDGGDIEHQAYGPTPLVAAMRAFVDSVLGDDVSIDARVQE